MNKGSVLVLAAVVVAGLAAAYFRWAWVPKEQVLRVRVPVEASTGGEAPGPAEPARPQVKDPVPSVTSLKFRDPAVVDQALGPFKFSDRTPLVDQVRELTKAVDPLSPSTVLECRRRAEEVSAALVVVLREQSSDTNMKEQALAMLKDLRVPSRAQDVLDAARRDPSEDVRTAAIQTLAVFPSKIRESEVRALYDGARSLDEKVAAVETLGLLGDAGSLPFLEATSKSAPDDLLLQVAQRAVAKVRIENSPQRDVELAQILYQENHELRDWALDRIVAGRKAEMAHHLRDVLDAHRKLPKEKASASFEYHLLRGLQELGVSLSKDDLTLIETYGIPRQPPLKE